MITAREANTIAENSATKHTDKCLFVIYNSIRVESEVGNSKTIVAFSSQECPTACQLEIILKLRHLGYKVVSPPMMGNQIVFHVSWSE